MDKIDSKVVDQFFKLFYIEKNEPNTINKHLSKIDQLKKFEDSFLSSDVFTFGIDYSKMQYYYVSPNIKSFLNSGLEHENSSISINKFLSIVKPDHLKIIVNKVLPYFIDFLQRIPGELSREELSSYRFSYNYELLTREGKYQSYIQRTVLLDISDKREPLIDLGIVEQNNFLDTSNLIQAVIEKRNNDGIFERVDCCEYLLPFNNETFSPRELEIIQLINKGLKVQDIADKLYISMHTVKVHKRNIFNKANVRKATELIAFCKNKHIYLN